MLDLLAKHSGKKLRPDASPIKVPDDGSDAVPAGPSPRAEALLEAPSASGEWASMWAQAHAAMRGSGGETTSLQMFVFALRLFTH